LGGTFGESKACNPIEGSHGNKIKKTGKWGNKVEAEIVVVKTLLDKA